MIYTFTTFLRNDITEDIIKVLSYIGSEIFYRIPYWTTVVAPAVLGCVSHRVALNYLKRECHEAGRQGKGLLTWLAFAFALFKCVCASELLGLCVF